MRFEEKLMVLVKGVYPALRLSPSLCLKENNFKSRMTFCSSVLSRKGWIKNQSPQIGIDI